MGYKVVLLKLIRRVTHAYIRKRYFCKGEHLVSNSISISEPGYAIFFGYHDKIPFSDDDTIILAHRGAVKSDDSKAIESFIEVGYYKLNDPKSFVKLGETNTWCWQQGSMLQFVPGTKSSQIIYNTLVNEKYGSRIVDVKTGKTVREYNFPIYSLSSDGKLASSLNFELLYDLRPGYGYYPRGEFKNVSSYLRIYDLNSSNLKWEKVLSKNKDELLYFNHVSFSPDNNRFVAFLIKKKESERKVDFILFDIKSKNISSLVQNKRISHYSWVGDNEILISEGKKIYWIPIYLNLSSLKFSTRFAKNRFYGDFHPMWISNKDLFLADTYVLEGGQKLLLSNPKTGKNFVLKKFSANPNFKGECRCDLHPRINLKGNIVCVDVILKKDREINLIYL